MCIMRSTILTLLATCLAFISCAQTAIDGNWILVEKNGEKLSPEKRQFKTFNNGYFAVLTVNPDGSHKGAWAGPFYLEGNKYYETFTFGSNPKWLGWKGLQEWYMKGDTLYMIGHKKTFDPEGKEHPGTLWGQFVEKRVRLN